MTFTYGEAKALVYEKCLQKNGHTEAVIFDDHTYEASFGWVFHYNNSTYYKTRLQLHAWVGPGPILFNKDTGEIRRFNSGQPDIDHIRDYEFELEADKADSEWCIHLENHDHKVTAMRFRKIFELDGREALNLAKKWSPYLLIGKRTDLEPLCEVFNSHGLNTRIELLKRSIAHPNCRVWSPGATFHDGYIQSLWAFKPVEVDAHLVGKEIFIKGLLTKAGGVPVVISADRPDCPLGFSQEAMIERIQKLEEGYKDLAKFDFSFIGTLCTRDGHLAMDQIRRFTLQHRDLGWGLSGSLLHHQES
jgi:hypothetical protein